MSPRLSAVFKFGRNRESSTCKQPIFLKLRASNALIIATVCVAVFVDIFLYAVPVPVLPFALRTRAGVPEDETQYWVSILIPVYGASLLLSSLICGWISDRISSRRGPFLVGLLLLAGATLFLALGNNVGLFIAGRLLQGASASVVWTAGLSVLVDTVGSQKIGGAMGWVNLAMSLSILLAPVLGGVVFHLAGYASVFGMCFALFGADAIMRMVMIEKKVKRIWIEGDSPPGVSTPHTECLQPSEVKDLSASSMSSQFPLSTTSLDLTLADNSIRHRIRAVFAPLMTLLSSRRLLSALWGVLVQASIFTAFDTTLPLHVHQVFSWSSLGAGLIFLPEVVPMFLAPVVGHFCDRYGPRYLSASGFLICFPFIVSMGLISHDSFEQKALLCFFLSFIGIGLTLAFSPLLAEITYVVESKQVANSTRSAANFGKNGAYAQAYSLYNIAFASGCVLGPLLGGLIKRRYGWGATCWTMGLLSAFTSVPAALWTGGWWFDKTKRNWNPAAPVQDEEMGGTTDPTDATDTTKLEDAPGVSERNS